jgi:hypothetical protein
MDREINLFNVRFESILKNIKNEVAARAIVYISDPLAFDYEFTKILRDTGYYALVNEYIDSSYDKNYKSMLEVFASGGLDVAFSKDDLATIAQLKQLDIQAFRDIGNQAALELKKDLYKYTLSNMKIADISNNIKQTLDGTDLAKYSKTYAETSISNFNQAIINTKAEGLDGVWIYVGVNDNKTRVFCKDVLNARHYYTNDQKASIENDPRRRWNCRHQLLFVSEEYAIERGYSAY